MRNPAGCRIPKIRPGPCSGRSRARKISKSRLLVGRRWRHPEVGHPSLTHFEQRPYSKVIGRLDRGGSRRAADSTLTNLAANCRGCAPWGPCLSGCVYPPRLRETAMGRTARTSWVNGIAGSLRAPPLSCRLRPRVQRPMGIAKLAGQCSATALPTVPALFSTSCFANLSRYTPVPRLGSQARAHEIVFDEPSGNA